MLSIFEEKRLKKKPIKDVVKDIGELTNKNNGSSSKSKGTMYNVPTNPMFFSSKKAKSRFYTMFCLREVIKAKIINMNEYKFLKITLF